MVLIIDKGVQDTFPNVAIALRMYLVLMVTNCSAERSFSKLKLSLSLTLLRQNRERCLVFDFRLVCVESFELQVHAELSRLIIG